MKHLPITLIFLTFLAIFPLATRLTRAQGTDLFFSEYIEGSSNNKAVEIYNPTSSSINLLGYMVNIYANGHTTSSAISIPSFSLTPGSVYVICNISSVSDLSLKCNQLTGSLNFNGNDAVALQKDTSVMVDVIGQIGFDPGAIGWETGAISTTDHTLVRKCSIDSGDPDGSDVFDPSVQWNDHDIDDFSNIGQHTLCLVTPTPTVTPTEVPTEAPTITPTATLTATPTSTPTATPTEVPTETPSPTPTSTSTEEPTVTPTSSAVPTVTPTTTPSPTPHSIPSGESLSILINKIVRTFTNFILLRYFNIKIY